VSRSSIKEHAQPSPPRTRGPSFFSKLGSRLRGNDSGGAFFKKLPKLFAESLTIGFAPAELTVRNERIACDPGYGSEAWHGALERLKETDLGSSRVTVELSSHFVRYALVPWSEALATPAEEQAYVRHHFVKIHGERAKGWAVRSTEAAPGEARLASAIDASLLEALKKAFQGKKAKLVSIQPALMRRFNDWRRELPKDGAWLVLAEAERACIALHGGKGWRAVQNTKGEWRAALERERHRVEGGVPSVVLIAGAAAPGNDSQWQFREMRT
jgi:hypothetical protein